MSLNEWMHKNKKVNEDLAKACDCTIGAISYVRNRRRTPSFPLALKLHYYTRCEVPLVAFLSKKDFPNLQEFLENIKKHKFS
jgi:transcriptional regulator with XRE-family HTH domain